jgi:hypothetical protein
VDFGRFGLVPDPVSGAGQLARRLMFTAVYSRHVGQRQPRSSHPPRTPVSWAGHQVA